MGSSMEGNKQMIRYLILGFIFFATSVRSQELFQLSLNGLLVQGSGSTLNGAVQYDGVENVWQQHYIGDFLYKNTNDSPTHTNADIGVKLDYKLTNRYYLQSGVRGEYDNLRDDPYSITTEAGIGYKFIHTSTVRLSDELGLGTHTDKHGSSPIVSNSIWITWKITGKLTFSNKLLIERGWGENHLEDDYYTSNITALVYTLSPKIDLNVQQKYKKERTAYSNITLLGLALHF